VLSGLLPPQIEEHAATQRDEVTRHPGMELRSNESSSPGTFGSDIQIRDVFLAEMTLLREKTASGFGHAESTVHQGLKAANYLQPR